MIDHQTIESFAEAFASAPRLAEMEVRSASHGVLRLRRSLQDAEKKPASRTKPATLVPGNIANETTTIAAAEPEGTVVTSTLVGIFRTSSRSLVEVGSVIKKGETLGSIEVMRLSNDVAAPVNGTISSIFVLDRQPVEYGQPLFEIDPNTTEEEAIDA